MQRPARSLRPTRPLAPTTASTTRSGVGRLLRRHLPVLTWLPQYRRADLSGDLLAGAVVAIVLVPQAMAYALLAGLPPQMGLYASVLPLFLYGLLGTSRYLAVGPTALVSLLVAAGLRPLATPESPAYATLALTLALLTGLVRIALGMLRVGVLLNVLSNPVLSGFTSAAAVLICLTQLRHLVGIPVPSSGPLHELAVYAVAHAAAVNATTLAIGLASIGVLVLFPRLLSAPAGGSSAAPLTQQVLSKSAPLLVVAGAAVAVASLELHETARVPIVGAIPSGWPPLTLPPLDGDVLLGLLPAALTISFVGYLEGISVAKSLASKRRQKVDVDQEMIAMGVATLGAAFTGGYPIGGSFSRSVVAFISGANTALAGMVTAGLLALVVLAFIPLLYHLPLAALAAIIVVACTNLIDLATLRRAWCYNRIDAASWLVTFGAVLELGVQAGVVVGVLTSLLLYLWRTSKPHVTIVGRVGTTEHFRSIHRFDVQTYPEVLAIRVDENLYFANARYVAELMRAWVADHPAVRHVVLICSGINYIDASALETLENLMYELRDAGITLHLAEVKSPILARLQRVEFLQALAPGRLFLSTHEAICALAGPPSEGPSLPRHEGR